MSKGTTLNMAHFFGTSTEKATFCSSLLATLKQRGCVKLQNHGIPDEEIHKLFDMTKRFFSLPLEQKMTIKHPPQANPNRGYSFIGQENVANISGYEKGVGPGKTRDIKETLDMGSASDSLVDNLWLAESTLPGFRAFMESFYDRAFETELHILSALAIALGVDGEKLKSMHDKAENEFRLLHYPAIPASELADGSKTRIAEHTDFGTITMLFQDSTGGLQVEDQEELGTFNDVESSGPTEIILNIGDSLQRLSNDTFRAACHRVTYPPTVSGAGDGTRSGEEMIPERYSIAYFAKPNRDAVLLPLREFVTDCTPCRYDEVTAWEWNNRRIQALYS
ncbi:hypothetical protein BJY04DRAFT_226543 [Aspergillus karnatakaensis]|uniref:isopenicillin N synthase family dioxygenase n=1 Tax=Aspergillus karnatakaensis TaxID=1810916 RepID=UPI003CCE0014